MEVKVRAIHDYHAQNPRELSFHKNAVITNVQDTKHKDWFVLL